MKAVVSTKYGGPEVLQVQVVDKPRPKKNEVLVKIHAATITRAETMMRTGYPLLGRLYMGLSKPKNKISGTGFSGQIVSLGKDIKHFQEGDKVFGESLITFGTNAEYVCIEEEGIITKMPENITYEEAAVVGDGLITSLNFLKKLAHIKAGQSILIIGASGSLGTAAVQLAKYYGAKITGICSSKNVELVKSLGAHSVIDYTKTDFTKAGNQYDIIYDTVGKSSFSKCKKSLTQKGVYMSPVLDFKLLLQMIWTSMFGSKKALFSATGMLPISEVKAFLKDIKDLFEAEKIKSIIEKRYTMNQISDAHRYIDTGRKKGNVVMVSTYW